MPRARGRRPSCGRTPDRPRSGPPRLRRRTRGHLHETPRSRGETERWFAARAQDRRHDRRPVPSFHARHDGHGPVLRDGKVRRRYEAAGRTFRSRTNHRRYGSTSPGGSRACASSRVRESCGGARGRAADGVQRQLVVRQGVVLWHLAATIAGDSRGHRKICVAGYAERPRGTMRASKIAVLSLVGILLIGAAAVLLLRMPKPATVTDGIAARYPGDVGIETDPDVFFVERFDEGTIASLAARYEDVLNQGDLSFVADVPSGSGASSSLLMTAVGGVRSGARYTRTSRRTGGPRTTPSTSATM